MNEQTLNAIRALLEEKVDPLVERVQALEGNPAQVETQPEQEAVDNQELIDLRKKLEAAESRAQRAEDVTSALMQRPQRFGRAVSPGFQGPAAKTGYTGLVETTRAKAPTLATVAERCIDQLTDADMPGTKVTRSVLANNLRAALTAAENDGVISNPFARAAWS